MSENGDAPDLEYRQTQVGVLGGGQLGRMLALAGYPLGIQFRFLDPGGSESPAGQLAGCVQAEYDDAASVRRFADGLDVVTYEFENVPVESAEALKSRVFVAPPVSALAAAQDRLQEKQLFQQLSIAAPKFASVSMLSELKAAIGYLGAPSILKTRRFGYDGKGQVTIRNKSEAEAAWQTIREQPAILEQQVDFDEEVSIIAARNASGETKFYPLAHNTHRDGILRVSWADPTDNSSGTTELTRQARNAAAKILERFDYVGVLALEMFVRHGQIIANEIAPRVHNSGHWSIEGAPCSQFENHIRAILGLSLGDAFGSRPAAMVNLIGACPQREAILEAVPDAHIHFYGKAPRPGRKVGHVSLLAESVELLQTKVAALKQLIGEP